MSTKEFGPVFKQPDFRVSNRYFLMLAKVSSGPDNRLGIVVGKKNVARAVQRNRIKRMIRETFRLRKSEFATIDLVVLARKGVDQFASGDIHDQLDLLLDELALRLGAHT
ncbi:MAG: ribonuclease P protein component [Pseudohongiellaceae bacterium]